ncbi:cell division protein FtsX [Acetobacter peroxydans]|jgi:cell division transport system permease protein|uniref:cell division protein FtsX n=1 Tax=Acetobacter peroxydans TaxID=104098 RepID=UPI002353F6C9|nr:FtsX-like permease family protein [Acetobacter peroxydans]MCH4143715.1 cell division protein FtsX [Acetobacter peroxydans]MCI1410199.1 cell division protein FtsX [Acetobacter peroxydans]MCI1439614.1 cell division protein FtsX [Acetobacter peroxydans]MCI1565900.1 cell division protein FtsX [Acetobacter peroxydans]MCI1617886.1 cell division protein FtsX [Acetobacter peroxydans]
MSRHSSRRRDGLSLAEAMPDRGLFALVAMVGFLAALTLAGAYGARALSARWAGGAAQLVIIQVPQPDQPAQNTGQSQAVGQNRADAVQDALVSLPAGSIVHRLSTQELGSLLQPWLGSGASSGQPGVNSPAIPMPAVIRVELPDDSAPPATLEQDLSTLAPGVIVEHNSLWSTRLNALANSLLACAGLALLTVCGVATLITGLTTRAGLASRRDVITTLHGLGASDSYIAGRFARRTASLAFGGGLVGTVLACLPLFALLQITAPFTTDAQMTSLSTAQDGLIDHGTILDTIPADLLIGLVCLPIAAALICWLTTQLSVRLWLRRLP